MLNDKVKEIHRDLEKEHGFNVAFTLLFGSQNYGLAIEGSDIDVQAYVIPSLDDLIKGVRVNKTYQTKYGEATVKDIREFPVLINKANPTTLEVMFTDYKYSTINLDELFIDREVLALGNPTNFLKATFGTISGKYKRIITMNSVDEKEVVHFMRLSTMIEDIFYKNRDFDTSLKASSELTKLRELREDGSNKHTLLEIKTAVIEKYELIRASVDTLLLLSNKKDMIYRKADHKEAINALERRVENVIRKNIDKREVLVK